MRLSISNIAWDVGEDEEVVELLHQYGIDAIDIAPGKYFQDFVNTDLSEIRRVKSWWSDRGVEIIGMQSLLFGNPDLNVFGHKEVQLKLLKHLEGICRIGNGLGARKLVFGSPKNRDRSGLNDSEVEKIAVWFFKELAEIAKQEGVVICLEPNPTYYGANFMTTCHETSDIVRAVDHQCVRMQLDTGALTINEEDPFLVLETFGKLIGHVHISEPDLLPIGSGSTDHRNISLALHKYLPDLPYTIEMVATRDEPPLISIEKAINFGINHYRSF